MRKSLLAASVSVAALALSSSQPLVAQSDVDQQLGNVHFKTSCNEVAQRRFDRAHALSALVLVPQRQGDLRGGAEGRPDLRHGAMGHRADAAGQSAQRDPAGQPRARPRRHPEGQGDGRQDRARARLHRRAAADVRRLRQAQPCPAHPRVPRRAGEDRGEVSGRRRGADRLRHHAQHLGRPRTTRPMPSRLKGAAILEPISQAPAAASGRHALPDPPLRLSGDRRRRGSTPPTATPRSRRPRRTPSTCRRTSTPASATGRNRSIPTSPR